MLKGYTICIIIGSSCAIALSIIYRESYFYYEKYLSMFAIPIIIGCSLGYRKDKTIRSCILAMITGAMSALLYKILLV